MLILLKGQIPDFFVPPPSGHSPDASRTLPGCSRDPKSMFFLTKTLVLKGFGAPGRSPDVPGSKIDAFLDKNGGFEIINII